MLRVDLVGYDEGLHTFSFAPDAQTLDLDPDTFSAIQVDLQVDYRDDRALVILTAQATARLECDRTLEPFDQAVQGSHTVLFTRDAEMAGEDDDDTRYWPPGENALDVAEPVRDTLLLALPLRRVAPDAEDEDLKLNYGALEAEDGTPIDPRWEALRKLQSGKSSTN